MEVFPGKGGGSPAPQTAVFSPLPWSLEAGPREGPGERRKPDKPSVAEVTHKFLLDSFAPPSVLVNPRGEILFIHGQTGKYLEPAPGQAGLNLVDMAREGIRFELRSALHTAFSKKKATKYTGLNVRTNRESQPVNLMVRPLPGTGDEGLALVSFEDAVPLKPKEPPEKKKKPSQRTERRVEELEKELSYTRESLQATIEESQAANEELQSTNEEFQSTNEELQSTNEELETSKEELQSVNEELITVNSELQEKIDQLSRTENDMKALLDSTNIAAIFLEENLGIKRFTIQAVKIFNLIPSDVGRPIGDIRSNLKYDKLQEDAQRVLDTLQAAETEVEARDHRWYLMRIMPSRTFENVIDGVAVTFSDVTQAKKAHEEILKFSEKARRYAESIVETIREPLLVLDPDLRVASANSAFYRTFGGAREKTEGRYVYELGNGQWDIPALRRLLEEILSRDSHFEDFRVEHDFPNIGRKRMVLNARRLVYQEINVDMILLAMEEVRE